MSDLIDRQAAISAIQRAYADTDGGCDKLAIWLNNGLTYALHILQGLQTAQPELDEWCTDCKEYDAERHSCPRWNRVIRETLNEVRKKGKWIYHERREPVWDITGVKTWGVAYRCPECSFIHSVIEDFGIYSYCPNCGADMRGEQDE